MKDLTVVLPSEYKELAQWNPSGYWELPGQVFVTQNEGIMIAIIDSALFDTLVAFWDETEQQWFHYTNCFGLGNGDDATTKHVITDWLA